jgi:hypothetical protein
MTLLVKVHLPFVSRVKVRARMMKNLIEPIKRNLVTSCLPYIGKIVRRILVNAPGFSSSSEQAVFDMAFFDVVVVIAPAPVARSGFC